jgi:ketosteroid isomerase-like protein
MRPCTATLFVCLTCTTSAALAQRTPAPAPACTTDVAADSTHPILKQIDSQYARLAAAMRARDVDALFALYTPDYHVVMPTGEVWSREQSLEYQRNGLAQVRETHHISNSIVRLVVCGDQATATVLQQWYRTQTMAGAPRRVETNAVQDEIWTRTPNGWKRGDIKNVRSGAAFVDGKRVDTRRPFDPNAPPYDPSARP